MKYVLDLFLEEIKTDEKKFLEFKKMAANCNNFELSAEIRKMEKEFFPTVPLPPGLPPDQILPTEKLKEIKIFRSILGLLGFHLKDDRSAFLIKSIVDRFEEIKTEFNINVLTEIVTDCDKYFDE